MSGELRQIARWRAICEARRRAAELVLAAQLAELKQREREVTALQGSARERQDDMQVALAGGELMVWHALDLQRAACLRAAQAAEQKRVEQSVSCAEAQVRLREREWDAERASTRYEQREQAGRVEAERREQGGSDDRFAAKKHWAETQRG